MTEPDALHAEVAVDARAPEADAAEIPPERSHAGVLRENVEAIIVAFVLALLIRQYAVEAFVIPTGSMAPTLLGAHVDVACPNCGREQPFGVHLESQNAGLYREAPNVRGTCGRCNFEGSYHVTSQALTGGQAEVSCSRCQATVMARPIEGARGDRAAQCWCPGCGIEYQATVDSRKWPRGDVSRGDRILVDKLSYHIAAPQRFEVAVFKFPLNPAENYIKRLIGLPGDTVEVKDGDIVVDGKIARKPDALQDQLWRTVHDSTRVEKDEGGTGARKRAWREEGGGAWSKIDGGRGFRGEAKGQAPAWLAYDRPIRDENTYNDGTPGRGGAAAGDKTVGDVRLRFRARLEGSAEARAQINVDGESVALSLAAGKAMWSVKDERGVEKGGRDLPPAPAEGRLVEVARFDGQVVVRVDDEEVGRIARSDAPRERETRAVDVRVGVAGGAAELSEITLAKDVVYLARAGGSGNMIFPLKVPEDRYFFMGDNAPSSRDGREWGTVPASHLVGRAFLVFWPAVPGDFAMRRIR